MVSEQSDLQGATTLHLTDLEDLDLAEGAKPSAAAITTFSDSQTD